MKWKRLGFLSCLLAILISIAAPLLVQDDSDRVHQHLDAATKVDCEQHTDGMLCTHLPLLLIDTHKAEIPGRPVYDETGATVAYTTTSDGSDTITASLQLMDDPERMNHPDDAPTLSTDATMHIRGRSSRAYDKPSYMLRFVNPDGSNNDQSVMGMAAHHEWVLFSSYFDRTLLRTYMWYNIAGEIMDWAPNVRFCELILNGQYQGIYLMIENITGGSNGARLPLSLNRQHQTFSGYLLDIEDKIDPEKNLDSLTSYARRNIRFLRVVYPGAMNITPALMGDIERDFSAFEKALYSYDYDHVDYGYKKLIDVDNFVDYFIINELTCNYDVGGLSTYIYKGTDGLFRMCVWDMDASCDNFAQGSMMDEQSFILHNILWYQMLFKDEDFTARIVERYRSLRQSWLDEAYLDRYIDDTVAYLGDAVERNYQVWGYIFDAEQDQLYPLERTPRSYEESLLQLKSFLHQRIEWMDTNIETLYQYSADSKVKKFNENAN